MTKEYAMCNLLVLQCEETLSHEPWYSSLQVAIDCIEESIKQDQMIGEITQPSVGKIMNTDIKELYDAFIPDAIKRKMGILENGND